MALSNWQEVLQGTSGAQINAKDRQHSKNNTSLLSATTWVMIPVNTAASVSLSISKFTQTYMLLHMSLLLHAIVLPGPEVLGAFPHVLKNIQVPNFAKIWEHLPQGMTIVVKNGLTDTFVHLVKVTINPTENRNGKKDKSVTDTVALVHYYWKEWRDDQIHRIKGDALVEKNELEKDLPNRMNIEEYDTDTHHENPDMMTKFQQIWDGSRDPIDKVQDRLTDFTRRTLGQLYPLTHPTESTLIPEDENRSNARNGRYRAYKLELGSLIVLAQMNDG